MISLQFSTERRLGSMLIRAYSHSPYSHVDAMSKGHYLLGARMWGGVQERSYNYANFTKRLHVYISASSSEAHKFNEFLYEQIGKPYDWLAYSGFLINRDWRKDNAWHCSELISAALEYSGAVPPLILPTNRVDPGDLLLVLSAMPYVSMKDGSLEKRIF